MSGTSRTCTGKYVTCSVKRAVMGVCLHSSALRAHVISSLGTHSWVVSWTLSHNSQVLYFISSHNGTLTRCGAQTNPSYHISWHMWPGAYSAWSLTIFDVSFDPNLSSTGIIRVTSGSNDTDTVPVSIQSTLPEPVVTKPPLLIQTNTVLVYVHSFRTHKKFQ